MMESLTYLNLPQQDKGIISVHVMIHNKDGMQC